ncbi:hypothetical protein BDK51DRAFT_39817 [Blyttiomyces helicus]|uniref:Uncharacterized protein n=1 Tax=Blyttiomyces helicus TaxID=388810 RepID=A0A4P9WMW5_9FUNG|nr:hypothetical protein BDK51DRAFT_39817 [Blyttiomyces helicus]|eukprot:RKO93028.1 hypothetical protein BDK51DRAFT_39817 [Blyttiomyces helicus]
MTATETPRGTEYGARRNDVETAADGSELPREGRPGRSWLKGLGGSTETADRIDTSVFAAAFRAYAAQHSIVVNRPTGFLPSDRFVIVRAFTTAGIGNRMPAVVTGLFLAMTTNRTLLVDWPEFEELFDPEIDVVLTVDRKVQLASAIRERAWDEGNATSEAELDEAMPRFSRAMPAVGVLIPVTRVQENLAKWITTDFRTDDNFGYATVITYRSMDYSTPLLMANPTMRPWFEALFGTEPGGLHPFHAAAKHLFRPQADIEREARAFHRRHLAGAGLAVGIQVRTRKRRATAPDLSLYFSTALGIGRSRQAARTGGDKIAPLRFFVASDRLEVADVMERALSPHPVFATRDVSLENPDQNRNPGTDRAAVVDMRILALCDELVVTFGSSFGQVAAAWGGISSVVIMHGTHAGWDRPFWWATGGITEPCMFEGRRIAGFGQSDSFSELYGQWVQMPLWTYHSQCHW